MYRLVQESGHLASLHWLSLVFFPCLLLFYTRAVYAVVLCLSVCLSVCHSRSSIETMDCTLR